MGTQTMGSNGDGGTQKPMLDGLVRQGSLYNLTLDQVHQQLGDLGKPLSSMNLDELLKSVWIAEANQGMLTMNNGPVEHTELTQLGSGSSRQLSLSLATDLTKKTVDEVWQDIQEGQKKKKKKKNTDDDEINNSCSFEDFGRKGSRDRQPTLGEMTLEDFLVKAGIVAESSPGKKNQVSGIGSEPIGSQETQWMQYQVSPIHPQNVLIPGCYQVQPPLSIGANAVMEMGYPETHMTMSPTPLMGGLSDAHMAGRKRVASGVVIEKTVERRQKRMIKNRESAARSRARKQAYTHELENKVSRLEEENERLRRQKEVEKVLPSVPPPEPKYQLRRTTSSPF